MTPEQAKREGWDVTPSPTRLYDFYLRATEAVRQASSNKAKSFGEGEGGRALQQAFLRRVSLEFHERLKQARIFVEGA